MIHVGCNAGIYQEFTQAVPGGTAARAYRDKIIQSAADVPTVFPGQAGAHNLVSIRPHPDYFLNSGEHYDPAIEQAISAMVEDGCSRFGALGKAPLLSSWHEAGNLYFDLPYITAEKIRQLHVKMYRLVQAVNANHPNAGVHYGPIWYGNPVKAVAWFPDTPVDFYGIDVYWNKYYDLESYVKLDAYLQPFRKVVQAMTSLKNPRIVVPECNTHNPANRPGFFLNLANWLDQNGGHRMYTFFKEGGPSGGAWDSGDQATIASLNRIIQLFGK